MINFKIFINKVYKNTFNLIEIDKKARYININNTTKEILFDNVISELKLDNITSIEAIVGGYNNIFYNNDKIKIKASNIEYDPERKTRDLLELLKMEV